MPCAAPICSARSSLVLMGLPTTRSSRFMSDSCPLPAHDSLHHPQLNPRPVRAAEIHALERLLEIVRQRLGNLHKLLRIAVRQRKPRALHLHHNPVSLPPGMRDVRQIERDPVRLIRLKRRSLLETLAELTTERL